MNSQIRVLILFVILGTVSFIILSKPYKNNHRYYENAGKCELFLPKEAVDINYFKAVRDWEGYDFTCTEDEYRNWVSAAVHVKGLEIKQGATFASYYDLDQEDVDQVDLKDALKATGSVDQKQVYFIYDLKASKAYFFSHAQ